MLFNRMVIWELVQALFRKNKFKSLIRLNFSMECQRVRVLILKGIYIEKIWKIHLSYIGHWVLFSALKSSCTATLKRDGFKASHSIVLDASLWLGKEESGITVRYSCL